MTWSDIPGWFDWQDIYDEWAHSSAHSSMIVEVGVHQGRSIAYLATKLRELKKRPYLYAIDSWDITDESFGLDGVSDARHFVNNMSNCGLSDRVIPMRASSVAAAAHFTSIDFCFLDASHEYIDVLTDIRVWHNRIIPGGMIAGHDFSEKWPGVQEAVREYFRDKFRVQGNCWLAQT